MTSKEQFLLGGVGGVLPVLIALGVTDIEKLLINLSLLAFASWLVKSVVGFMLGGLYAYMHEETTSRRRAIELGVIAPAVLSTWFYGAEMQTPDIGIGTPMQVVGSLLSSTAYAQGTLQTFSYPQETWKEQFLRGFLGITSKRVWFVVAGRHITLENAEAQAEEVRTALHRAVAASVKPMADTVLIPPVTHLPTSIADEIKDLPQDKAVARILDEIVSVYAPFAHDQRYSVVIGAHLTLEEARAYRDMVIAEGINNVELWTFPTK